MGFYLDFYSVHGNMAWMAVVLSATALSYWLGYRCGWRDRGRKEAGAVTHIVTTIDQGSTITIAPSSHGVEVGDKIVFHHGSGRIGGGIDGSSY